MIYGIGVDSTTIERIRKSIAKEHFLTRVYSAQEQALFAALAPHHAAESAAANFAVKEAFMKAAGYGLGHFALKDIAVLRKESGAPYFLPGATMLRFLNEKKLKVHVSITHEQGTATAFVVLEDI